MTDLWVYIILSGDWTIHTIAKFLIFLIFFNFVPFSDQVTDHFPLNSVLVQFLTLTHDEKARC